LDTSSVRRIEVFYIPATVETPVALNPSDLERTSDFRLTIDTSASPHVTQSLASTLRASKVYGSSEKADVRFGVVLYGNDANRVGAIYLGGNCKTGQVDDASVKYAGDLCSWVTHSFSGVL
jgi:hypothetical protein